MRRYPPLKALPAFEAAMRRGSFTLAADELRVTPGAIGQQIQKLEAWLGVTLFVRQIRQVTPTSEGRAYFAQIRPALAEIVSASHRLRERRKKGVRLSMPPSFAAKWFGPRMADFLQASPGMSLSLSTTTTMVDFELDGVDLAVRHFDGNAPHLCVQLLCHDEARVYCHPAYAKKRKLRRPDDLRSATLLHNTLHPYWKAWFDRFTGLDESQIEAIAGLQFDQSLMAIEAAVSAQGVVLTSPLLLEAELARGELVDPFGKALPLERGYYLVHPDTGESQQAVQSLKGWFAGQMAIGTPG
ncbi:LysR substrate-binding domain-containing protein [Paraburkholderia sp. SARCC-3016]|uniref:LysR substrate-binding domain-containing protein n=1 Tax=Paraburkholderia sp. SARCC-3016 TaxID=3058611 RepID=UPI0028078668|nr:LysR substrate-binding domain-containing protein [Paraburkholderia sp. SARCC-3016]MDQ7976681.1 LysR substrate-binding domain-containing protein [Paraburkholderia sp. SARCC-3016]